MTRPPLHRLLWGTAVLLTVCAAAISANTYHQLLADDMGTSQPLAATDIPVVPMAALDRAVIEIRLHDLFQPSRRPPTVQQPESPVPDPVSASPRPQLELRGILGGPPWNAILRGIPGSSADLVVQEGDTVNGLRIEAITSSTVVVLGHDTTWTLVLIR